MCKLRPLNSFPSLLYGGALVLVSAVSGFRQGKGNQMSLLVFYNALLSTLGKHLGIIGTTAYQLCLPSGDVT